MKDSYNNEVVNILVECPELIASVRMGVLEPLLHLEKSGRCIVFFKKTIEITKKDIEWCDILITVRGYEYITLKIVKAAQKAGRYIIYFLDDDLLSIPSDIPSGKYFNSDVKKTMIQIMKYCNVLWCVNELIGKKYSNYCKYKWILGKVPIEINESLIENKREDIRILYAGSTDHSKTVQKYISPAVIRLCVEYRNNVSFTFIGADPDIRNQKNVKYYAFFDSYAEYKNLVKQGNFDIGLAIILEDEFYKCKYYNKFLEYTSIGAVGVYTKSEPYTLIVKDKENGILCENDEWYIKLKEIIEDKQLRRKCVNNAKNMLKEEFNYSTVSKEIVDKLPEIILYHADKSKRVVLHNIKFYYYNNKLISLWKQYKIIMIPFVFAKLLKRLWRLLLKTRGVRNDNKLF